MTDEAALLAAIRDNPDEDTPRLAFADWLDEQGGEANAARAEYTRLEIARARTEEETGVRPDDFRQAELWKKYSADWFPAFYGKKNLLRGTQTSVRLRRGFTYCFYSRSAGAFLARAERLLPLAPITDLILSGISEDELSTLERAVWATRLRYIQLAGYTTPVTRWVRLADNPHLANLTELVLCDGIIDAAAGARLAGVNPWPHLRRLAFSVTQFSDAGIAALFGGSAFTGLEALDLSERGENLTVAAVDAVAAAEPLAGLKALDIAYRPRPWLIAALAKARFWPKLESLHAQRSGLGNAGIGDLVRVPPEALRVLSLDDNGITAAGVRELADSSVMATLEELDLSGNPIGDAGVKALAESPHSARLRKLDLGLCKFGPDGAKALAESPHLANLRDLRVGHCGIGVAGAKALAASPYLGNLTKLWASGLTPAGKKHLKTRFGRVASL